MSADGFGLRASLGASARFLQRSSELLLTLEAGAAVVLLGAQVIADLKHSAARGLAWHEAPARRYGG